MKFYIEPDDPNRKLPPEVSAMSFESDILIPVGENIVLTDAVQTDYHLSITRYKFFISWRTGGKPYALIYLSLFAVFTKEEKQ